MLLGLGANVLCFVLGVRKAQNVRFRAQPRYATSKVRCVCVCVRWRAERIIIVIVICGVLLWGSINIAKRVWVVYKQLNNHSLLESVYLTLICVEEMNVIFRCFGGLSL